jgi:hypothetical protein
MRQLQRPFLVLLTLMALTVVLAVPLWHYRHSVVALGRKWALPDTPPVAADAMRFAVIGDYGMGTPYSGHVALMIESWNPQFIVTVGDNNYPDGSWEKIDQNIGQFYHGYIAPYRGEYGPGATENRFFPVPGHVDWDTDSLAPYLDYFTLPGNERYYDVVKGPVHFFMLDSDKREPDGVTVGSVQAQWLEEGLQKSSSPWNLVVAHHAPYTSHTVPDNEWMRWPFKKWGVDAVLSGYYHVYERLEVDSIPYFIDGTGGTWVSHFGETDPHSRFRYNGDLGAMIVDASENRLEFRYVNRFGRILDELTLSKTDERPDGDGGSAP